MTLVSPEEGIMAVRAARSVTEAELRGGTAAAELPPSFSGRNMGIFVALNEYPSGIARACVGYPISPVTADKTLVQCARSVCYDEKFPRLKPGQTEKCVFEVSFLTAPEKIEYADTEELKSRIELGKDGLMVRYVRNAGLSHSALYLPRVPVEMEWNIVDYLENVCMKAGMQSDSWKSGVLEFYRFRGETFGETEPNGEIRRK